MYGNVLKEQTLCNLEINSRFVFSILKAIVICLTNQTSIASWEEMVQSMKKQKYFK